MSVQGAGGQAGKANSANTAEVRARFNWGCEIGRGWHKLRFSTGLRRWPTVLGENPPQGVPYRNVEASYGSRCIQVRVWDWRQPRASAVFADRAFRKDNRVG